MAPRTKFSAEQLDEAVRLYESGKSISQVAKETGISDGYVKDVLHKRGVAVRPPGFRPGNLSRTGKPHSEQSKALMKEKRGGKRDWLGQMMSLYKRNALKDKREFLLDRETFESLVTDNCFYCGAAPKERWLNTNNFKANGIDRIDSRLGYTPDNVISCCWICNRMKMDMSRNAFLLQCSTIAIKHGLIK